MSDIFFIALWLMNLVVAISSIALVRSTRRHGHAGWSVLFQVVGGLNLGMAMFGVYQWLT